MHGNTTLEIAWTVIPLVILVMIAIPTVRTIFATQAAARSDALQVEVIGHQWWWEFRYPQYTAAGANGHVDTVVTANELYLPIGQTVNFTLQLQGRHPLVLGAGAAGKRDVIPNHTNYLWFTPDSVGADAFNGACVEYCGTSHANMRFKTFTVTQADFDSWVAHQLTASGRRRRRGTACSGRHEPGRQGREAGDGNAAVSCGAGVAPPRGSGGVQGVSRGTSFRRTRFRRRRIRLA